ncbi:phosphoribosylanthranilate isomerase [Alkalihalophilus marmarensis]|uniref:N-(5'-phosphoribosyl)anthranilate isomerase n=1 Tax=Alkalihalophilus marmarensis DSM 21297 TaxID=1188261 RepID=U6SRD6_9BACI|nr:phosphoribosylanthranilate isomerase [Alkalihalophilus marmarensis]ERN54188.1 N-(5'-phosphoribosyl)anthranilate isomerase [Alkalihalophilus marmarensis DSM 21297]MCM3488391.1 phosphoribosylanthranilate isomerase [Alkalihalophilus marmarensis]
MRPLVKICGNYHQVDVASVTATDVDYMGFVFVPSKRQVTINQVKSWLDVHPGLNQKIVALFVNESISFIKEVYNALPVEVIQCHGTESIEYIKELREELDCEIWKVIHAEDQALAVMSSFEGLVDGYVVDCKVSGQWGGTGQSFNWDLIPSFLEEGERQSVKVLIAGGVAPHNIEKLVSYQPDGIDISSGVETNGHKDQNKIEYIIERVSHLANNNERVSR